jgi:hypothetical protein
VYDFEKDILSWVIPDGFDQDELKAIMGRFGAKIP